MPGTNGLRGLRVEKLRDEGRLAHLAAPEVPGGALGQELGKPGLMLDIGNLLVPFAVFLSDDLISA